MGLKSGSTGRLVRDIGESLPPVLSYLVYSLILNDLLVALILEPPRNVRVCLM